MKLMKLRFPLERPVEDRAPGKWRPFGVGIDVHKEMVWACVLRANYNGFLREAKQIESEIC